MEEGSFSEDEEDFEQENKARLEKRIMDMNVRGFEVFIFEDYSIKIWTAIVKSINSL